MPFQSDHAASVLEASVTTLQASNGMRKSIENLRDALRCSLCNNIYQTPMTLSCAHSFCQACIDAHACDSWECPFPDCGRSYSMQTSGSFRKINPTLQTLVTSLQAIMDTLQRAPPAWWKEGNEEGAIQDLVDHDIMDYPTHMDQDHEEDDDDDISIDLQQPHPHSKGNDNGDGDDQESTAVDLSLDSDD